MGNRSLMDRTPDSDSGNAGSIPAGCSLCYVARKQLTHGTTGKAVRHAPLFYWTNSMRCGIINGKMHFYGGFICRMKN